MMMSAPADLSGCVLLVMPVEEPLQGLMCKALTDRGAEVILVANRTEAEALVHNRGLDPSSDRVLLVNEPVACTPMVIQLLDRLKGVEVHLSGPAHHEYPGAGEPGFAVGNRLPRRSRLTRRGR
jgi:hypothetical protein